MAHYFMNLLTAICGNNPYQKEMDKVREELDRAGETVRMLQDAYQQTQEKAVVMEKLYGEALKTIEDAGEQLEKHQKCLTSYQTLVENQRKRVEELKDERNQMIQHVAKMEQDYEKRIAGYATTISMLHTKINELQGESLNTPACEKGENRSTTA